MRPLLFARRRRFGWEGGVHSEVGDSNERSRWLAVAMFAGVAVVLYIVVAAAFGRYAHLYSFGDDLNHPRPDPAYTGPRWLAGWVRFDALWYRSIAVDGYFFRGRTAQSSVAFFPMYPLLMRALQRVFGGDVAVWGIPITAGSGLVGVSLYWRWVKDKVHDSARTTALAVLLLWPYALYLYGAVYADALFLALALAAFTCVERDRIVLAALFGAAATATRPVGIAVVLGLSARVIEQRGVVRLAVHDGARRLIDVNIRRLRPTDPFIAFSAAGLVSYSIFLSRRFGDPFAFATAEAAPGWDQNPGWNVWLKHAWVTRLTHLPDSGLRYFGVVTLQGVLAIGFVLLVPRIVHRFGWAYGVYTLVLLAFPLAGSKDFQGLGRYALGAFPAFAVLGELLAEHQRIRRAWLAASALGLIVFCGSFARNGYVA
jgi:hypothetical protein